MDSEAKAVKAAINKLLIKCVLENVLMSGRKLTAIRKIVFLIA